MAKRVEFEAILEDGRYRRTLASLQGASGRLGLAPNLRQAQGPLNNIVASAGRLGPLAIAATAAFAGFTAGLNKALTSFRGFETSLARVATTTGQTLAQVQSRYGVLIQDIARQTGIATADIASGVQKAISGGIEDSEEIALIVQQSARFAAAGLGDLATAISATTTVFANFREAGLNTAEIMDSIALAAMIGEGEVEDFSPAFKRLSGTAALLNIEIAELGALIANISQTAPSVSEGVTQLEGVFKLLVKPSQQARDALAGIGTSVAALRNQIRREGFVEALDTLQDAIAEAGPELAGTLFRDFQGVLGQQNLDPDAIRRFEQRIASGMGTAIDGAFDQANMTIDAQMSRLTQAWETGWQRLGETAADALEVSGAVETLASLANEAFELYDTLARLASREYRQAAERRDLRIEIQAELSMDSRRRVERALAEIGRTVPFATPEAALRAGRQRAQAELAALRQEREDIFASTVGDDGEEDLSKLTEDENQRLLTIRRLIGVQKEITAEVDKQLAASSDNLELEDENTAQKELQEKLTADVAAHYNRINSSLQTQEERLDASIQKTRDLIAAQQAGEQDTTELDALLARQLKAREDARTKRENDETAAMMRREEREANEARRRMEREQRDAQNLELDRIDRERRLLQSRAGPVDDTTTQGFAAERQLLLSERELAIQELRALYVEGTQELADELLIVNNEFDNAVNDLEARQMDSVQRATEEYQAAFSELGRTIGDAFTSFEDSTEGWFNLLFDSLPQLISQFGQLSDAAQGLGNIGGSGGSGFLSLLGGIFGGARADGGPVSARQMYLVGERGPEWFVPGAAGQIINNQQAFGAMTMNLNFNGVGGSDRETIRAEINSAIPQIATAGQAFLRRARIEGPR